jgi:hypothetical protein
VDPQGVVECSEIRGGEDPDPFTNSFDCDGPDCSAWALESMAKRRRVGGQQQLNG